MRAFLTEVRRCSQMALGGDVGYLSGLKSEFKSKDPGFDPLAGCVRNSFGSVPPSQPLYSTKATVRRNKTPGKCKWGGLAIYIYISRKLGRKNLLVFLLSYFLFYIYIYIRSTLVHS